MVNSQGKRPDPEKERWEIINIKADVFHKILILIIGTAIAAIFYMFQQKQMESRYFADLMAQRENTESQLRAQMFKTLFDAYFANKLQGKALVNSEFSWKFDNPGTSITTTREVIIAQFDKLKQETMFIDLLSRNFENIDVRPLFEELDDQLSSLLISTNKRDMATSSAFTDLRHEIFALRNNLQRVAIGASSRQITALVGAAHASITTHKIKQCGGSKPEMDLPFPLEGVNTIIDKLNDGAVTLRLVPPGQTEPIHLRVTFYDMPSLEKMVLPITPVPESKQISFTLSRYISFNACKEFKEQLDQNIKADCEGLLSEKKACDLAWVRVVDFPHSYIGSRDRPYLNDLLAGDFQKANQNE